MSAVDAASVDTDRAGAFEHVGAGRVAVDDERAASPGVRPQWCIGLIGAFGRFAFFVDHLNFRNRFDGLGLPGHARQEAAMHEDGLDCDIIEVFGHSFEEVPVLGGQLCDCFAIIVFKETWLLFTTSGE